MPDRLQGPLTFLRGGFLKTAMAVTAYTTGTYDVGGVLLERPFKIRRLGHFGFNVDRLEEAPHFYVALLGFMISDEIAFGARLTPEQKAASGQEGRGYFTRYGSDHHSFVLFPRKTLEQLGMGGGEV